MTVSSAPPAAAAPAAAGVWLHRFATLVACCTFLLVIAGGLVTSTGSALAVPDWPLSFGQVFPRMEGGVLFEHGHRLIAATVGALTVVLAVWASRVEQRAPVRVLAWTLLGVVVLQGVFGGVTVLLRLPSAVSVAHAGLAQIFFALTVTMAAVTSPAHASARPLAPGGARGTPMLTLATVLVVYAQILLGAIVRHTGAGLAIPDFPLSFGRLVPEFSNSLIMWQYAHRVGALVASLVVGWTALRTLWRAEGGRFLLLPAALLLALLGFQILLGALTIWSLRAVVPTTAHVATGSLLLATSVVLAVRVHYVADGGAA
jgi:heme A synthase